MEEVLWKAGVVDEPHSWVVHLVVVDVELWVDRVDLVVVDGLERRRVPGVREVGVEVVLPPHW